MKFGCITYWYERGQAFFAREIRRLLCQAGHDVFIFARQDESIPRAVFHEQDWSVPNLTRYPEYKIPFETLSPWIDKRALDVVFFNEEYDFDLVRSIKQKGIRTIGVFWWELFDPQWVDLCNEVYDLIICPFEACYDKFKNLGVKGAKHVKWGAFSDEIVPVSRKAEKVKVFHPGGWGGWKERRATRSVVDAFYELKNFDCAELHIHLQCDIGLPPFPHIEISYGTLPRGEFIKLFANADIVAIPDRWTGLGLNFFEAMSAGLPILTVDGPPMNEFVRSGVNGFCCKVARTEEHLNIFVPALIVDPKDMAEKMSLLVSQRDLLEEMKQVTRAYFEQKWSWEVNGPPLVAAFEFKEEKNGESQSCV